MFPRIRARMSAYSCIQNYWARAGVDVYMCRYSYYIYASGRRAPEICVARLRCSDEHNGFVFITAVGAAGLRDTLHGQVFGETGACDRPGAILYVLTY